MKNQLLCVIGGLLSTAGYAADPVYEYRVQQGDNLTSISRNYLAQPRAWAQLQGINGLKNPNYLRPGSIVKIPATLIKYTPSRATVLSVNGTVEGSSGKLLQGATVGEGERIQTAPNASVTLKLADGSVLTLQPQSQLELGQLREYPSFGVVGTLLRLLTGRLENMVSKRNHAIGRYEVVTPTATGGVRGTNFRVATDEATRSEVLEGEVAMRGNRKPDELTPVPAGFGTKVDVSGTVAKPVALLPAPSLNGAPASFDPKALRFTFAAVPGALQYRAQIFSDDSYRAVLREAVSERTEVAFNDLPEGDYAMRLRAIDGNGLEGYNAQYGFKVRAVPLPAPAPAPLPAAPPPPRAWLCPLCES